MKQFDRIARPGIAISLAMALAALAPSAASAQAAGGEQIFRQKCQMCHVAAAGKPAGIGPNLAGVVGRKSGGAASYAYSPALKNAKLVWTKANLDRFLSGPAKMVPGTRMSVVISDPAQRAALIQYLSKAR